MYEEDRIRVLELYDELFDESDNETAVLQLLVSPTRQAVNLARAYDAKDRSYQEEGSTPGYLQVIDQLRAQVQALAPAAPRLDNDQLSLFEQVNTRNDPLADLGIREAEELPPAPLPEEINSFPDEDKDTRTAASTPPAVPVKTVESTTAQEQSVDEFADAVEAFLADFRINDDTLTANSATPVEKAASAGSIPEVDRPDLPDMDGMPADSPAPEQDAVDAPAAVERQIPVVQAPPVVAQPQPKPALQAEKPAAQRTRRMSVADLPDLSEPEEPTREPNIPLLILFILIAIPLGLLCAGVIVTLACASLSVGAGLLGGAIIGFRAAFTAFSVFADILLVFGLSLAAAAFSLLFFWIFVWLLIGVLPDMVRGICALARKLCYREVTE